MANGSYKGKADALCPFYRYDELKNKKIVCEGIVDKSVLSLAFRRRKDYDTQLIVFCCEYYKNCEIYRMLMEHKYDEEA